MDILKVQNQLSTDYGWKYKRPGIKGTGTARLEYKSQISQSRVIPGEKTLRGRTSWETFRVEL